MSDHHEPNGEDSIPMWLWIVSYGILVFTLICFLIMLAGMVWT